MKQQVSPVVAIIAVLVVVGIAALAFLKFGSVSHSGKAPSSMPEDVQKHWQELAGGAVPGKSQTSGPSGTGTVPGVGQMSGSGGGARPGMPQYALPAAGGSPSAPPPP